MNISQAISGLIQDPPPQHAFEISEAGISYAHGTQTRFEAFEPGTVVVSPSSDNILRPELVSEMIAHIAPANGVKKRRPAVLILPDYAARVTVLDFDSFPTVAAEQLPLVKFRIKKTIPFDIESAAVSFFVQPGAGKKVEVLAVTMAFDIVARYEALFRAAGFQTGEVTTSTLAALNLYRGEGVSVVAKLIVGTGATASTATTVVVSESASLASSSASALRRLAAASAMSSSSSCGLTPMPAAHRRPMSRRSTCSIWRQRASSDSISIRESRYFCFQSEVSDTAKVREHSPKDRPSYGKLERGHILRILQESHANGVTKVPVSHRFMMQVPASPASFWLDCRKVTNHGAKARFHHRSAAGGLVGQRQLQDLQLCGRSGNAPFYRRPGQQPLPTIAAVDRGPNHQWRPV